MCIYTCIYIYICQHFHSSCVSSSIFPKFCVCVCVCVSAVVGLLLCVGFLYLRSAGSSLCCSVWSSHCSGSSCCGAQALGHMGFDSCTWGYSSYSLWAPEYGLSSCGTQVIVVLWHVGSSWSRDQTRVPCIGRWVLNYCATRES